MTKASSSSRILLIVDPQNDFISGSLSVPDAQKAMDALCEFVQNHGNNYRHIFVTTDWHPTNHCSFVGEGGQWPSHCVQDTEGAALYAPLEKALLPFSPTLLKKGDTAQTEEYSIFKNKHSAALLRTFIAQESITQIDLCGIAGDICVRDTYNDGIALFPPEYFYLLPDFCPSLDGGAAIRSLLCP